MHSPVRLTILCEDQARMGFLDKMFLGAHGLSVCIEADAKILFDVGPSGVTLENAKTAGMRLDDVERIVLSHGHWDHADGLEALANAGIRPEVLAHPEVFNDRRRASGEFNGMAMSRERLRDLFPLTESRGPVRLSPSMWFLGEVPRTNSFEAKQTPFYQIRDGQKQPDFLMDDTALALCSEQGLVVVTGCSHAGICNICEYAKQITGEQRLHMVLGGFHLLDDSDVLANTMEYFKKEQAPRLHPMHCTALPALARMWSAFNITRLCVGDSVEI